MKKAVEIIVAVKNIAAMAFTGMVMLYMVFGELFGLTSISFSLIWQAIFIALICGVLQFIAFSDYVIKKMKFSRRSLLFIVPLYAAISAFAVCFSWFPISAPGWGLFTVIFFVIFAIMAAAFEAYFRITGNRYTQMLNIYKTKQEK